MDWVGAVAPEIRGGMAARGGVGWSEGGTRCH